MIRWNQKGLRCGTIEKVLFSEKRNRSKFIQFWTAIYIYTVDLYHLLYFSMFYTRLHGNKFKLVGITFQLSKHVSWIEEYMLPQIKIVCFIMKLSTHPCTSVPRQTSKYIRDDQKPHNIFQFLPHRNFFFKFYLFL